MSERDDGGPAFPDPGRGQSSKARAGLPHTGATLRDFFAASALQGLLASPRLPGRDNETVTNDVAARCAYEAADAMLAERAKP
jgi:hypothetical protein